MGKLLLIFPTASIKLHFILRHKIPLLFGPHHTECSPCISYQTSFNSDNNHTGEVTVKVKTDPSNVSQASKKITTQPQDLRQVYSGCCSFTDIHTLTTRLEVAQAVGQ